MSGDRRLAGPFLVEAYESVYNAHTEVKDESVIFDSLQDRDCRNGYSDRGSGSRGHRLCRRAHGFPEEDIFAEMESFMVKTGGADCSRESIYTRMVGE